jgi:hypothetical protein
MDITKEVDKHGAIRYRNESGQLHREDGPAFEKPNGYKVWLINGKYHREDGPAFEYPDGGVEYWLNDMGYSKEEYEQEILKRRLKRILDL